MGSPDAVRTVHLDTRQKQQLHRERSAGREPPLLRTRSHQRVVLSIKADAPTRQVVKDHHTVGLGLALDKPWIGPGVARHHLYRHPGQGDRVGRHRLYREAAARALRQGRRRSARGERAPSARPEIVWRGVGVDHIVEAKGQQRHQPDGK